MKRLLTHTFLALMLLVPTSGCGTVFFSQRQHEPHSRKLDPNVVILDGIGLLFFIIPGIVAFGFDFYTGAIYLPPGVEKGEGPFIFDSKESEGGDDAESEGEPESAGESEDAQPAG